MTRSDGGAVSVSPLFSGVDERGEISGVVAVCCKTHPRSVVFRRWRAGEGEGGRAKESRVVATCTMDDEVAVVAAGGKGREGVGEDATVAVGDVMGRVNVVRLGKVGLDR